MSFSIQQYYLFIVCAFSVFVCFNTPDLAEEFLIFAALNVLFFFMYGKWTYFSIPLFFLLGSVFGGIFFRTYSIYNNLEAFRYYMVFPLKDHEVVEVALQNALLSFIFVLMGYFLCTILLSKKKFHISNQTSPTLLSNTNLVIIVLAALIGLKLFLHLGLGIGLKGVRPTNYIGFLFLIRLIPTELPFIIVTLFLVKYKKQISFAQYLIFIALGIGSVMAVFVTGSKTFVLNFGLCLMVYALYNRIKISLAQFLVIAAFSTLLIAFSIISAEIVKFQVIRGSDLSLSATWEIFLFAIEELDPYDILASVSTRFSGMDGQILLEQASRSKLNISWTELYAVYHPVTIVLNTLESIIPGVNLTQYPACGPSIGAYVFHMDTNDEFAFGGALGLFASLKLISNLNMTIYYILLFVWGILIGLYFRMIRRIKDADLRFIFYFFGSFMVMHMTISGNFDMLFALFTIKIILLFAYGLVILLLRSIVKPPRKKLKVSA